MLFDEGVNENKGQRLSSCKRENQLPSFTSVLKSNIVFCVSLKVHLKLYIYFTEEHIP